MRVERVTTDVGAWFVKQAESAEESRHLQREAAVLARAAHPGVVELGRIEASATGRAALWTRHVPGSDLAAAGPLTAVEVAGLGAALATVVADLHDLGVVHGSIHPDHVLLGQGGHPVLCGFGHGAGTPGLDPAQDVADVSQLLADRLPPDAPRRLASLLGRADRRRRQLSARALALALTRLVPDARLPALDPDEARLPPPARSAGVPAPGRSAGVRAPDADADADRRRPQRGRRRSGPDAHLPAGTAAAPGPATSDSLAVAHHPLRLAVAAAGGSAATRARGRWRSRRVSGAGLIAGAALLLVGAATAVALGTHVLPAAAPGAASCPGSDAGCHPIPVDDGAFRVPAGHFATDLRDAVIVLGRWDCGPPSLPAALDPGDGRVWIWDRWSGSQPTPGRAVGTVRGATTLRTLPRRSGCDLLQVRRAHGRPVVVDPRAGHA